jgi:uncharacterized membrane protein
MTASNHKRAIGIFPTFEEAEPGLNDLKAAGFPMDHISVIAKQADQEEQIAGVEVSDRIGNQNVETSTGLVKDAVNNATWGTILVGFTSLAIPGAGPFLAAGTLGIALVSSLAGIGLGAAATQALIKALANLGIPDEQARAYSDRLIQGDHLVILDGTDQEIEHAEKILGDRGIQNWSVYEFSPA